MIYAQTFKRIINETKIPSLQIAGYGVSEPSTLFQVMHSIHSVTVNDNTRTPSLKFYKCDNLHSNIPTQKIHFSPQIGSVALWSESVAATREFVGCSSFERMAVKLNHWL